MIWDQSHMLQSGTYNGTLHPRRAHARGRRLVGPARPLVGHPRPRPLPAVDVARRPAARRHARRVALGAGQRRPHLHRRLLRRRPTAASPIPVVDFHHDLDWIDADGGAVSYARDGDEVAGIAGHVDSPSRAGGRSRSTPRAAGPSATAPLGGGLNQVEVTHRRRPPGHRHLRGDRRPPPPLLPDPAGRATCPADAPVHRSRTYRFQLTPDVGFDAAPPSSTGCSDSGISHVYLSPVTEAVPGSTHGYDVVDHTRVRDELGGLDGLTALLDAAAARRMGVVVDHVANHVAVGRAELNRAVVGDAARRSRQRRPPAGSTSTGRPAAAGAAAGARRAAGRRSSARSTVVDGELRARRAALPAGRRAPSTLDARRRCSARQHYRLMHWRRPERNVRRFFTIDDLVAVRVEHPEVAAAVDTVPRLLADHPAFAGVRVDHVDGLADPLGYLERAARADRRPLAARREDPRRRRDAARRVAGRRHDRLRARPRARARPARRATAGTCCAGAGSPRPATAGRSGRGSWRPGARCSTAGCGRTSSGSPRVAADRLDADERRRSSRRRRAQRAPRALPHVPARRRGRPALDAGPRRGRGEPAATWRRCSTRLVTELRDSRRRRGRRVAHPLAAAHRAGDGQGRRGPRVLALRAAGVARRGRRRRRARRRRRPGRRPARPPRRRRPRGGRRRCSPARPTTPRAPRTSGPSGWRWPPRRGAWRRAGRRVVDGPRLAVDIDLAMQWLALQTVVTTPGLDGDRLARVPRQGGAGGRRAHVVDRARRGVRAAARPRSPTSLLEWPPAAELAAELDAAGSGDRRWRCSPCG